MPLVELAKAGHEEAHQTGQAGAPAPYRRLVDDPPGGGGVRGGRSGGERGWECRRGRGSDGLAGGGRGLGSGSKLGGGPLPLRFEPSRLGAVAGDLTPRLNEIPPGLTEQPGRLPSPSQPEEHQADERDRKGEASPGDDREGDAEHRQKRAGGGEQVTCLEPIPIDQV